MGTKRRTFYGVSAVGLLATLSVAPAAEAEAIEPEPAPEIVTTAEMGAVDPAVEAYINYLFHEDHSPDTGFGTLAAHSADNFSGVCAEHTHTYWTSVNANIGGVRFFSTKGEISWKDKCYGGITGINFRRITHDVTTWGSLNGWSWQGVDYNDTRYVKWRNHPKGKFAWDFGTTWDNVQPAVGDMHHNFAIKVFMNGDWCYTSTGGSKSCPSEY